MTIQAHAPADITLGIPLMLTSFCTINTKNTPLTLRRECAHSALAAVLADITVSRAGGGHQPLRVWRKPPGRRAASHLASLNIHYTLTKLLCALKCTVKKPLIITSLCI